jgi:hypothetical protein
LKQTLEQLSIESEWNSENPYRFVNQEVCQTGWHKRLFNINKLDIMAKHFKMDWHEKLSCKQEAVLQTRPRPVDFGAPIL